MTGGSAASVTAEAQRSASRCVEAGLSAWVAICHKLRMTTRKRRHHLYLSHELSQWLDGLAADPRTSKSAIVGDALAAWREARGGDAIDARFGVRIDRIGRGQDRLEERLAYVAEALGTFVQHHLTQTAQQPAFTPEAVHLGQLRFRAFVEAVGRRLARQVSSEQAKTAASSDGAREDFDERP